MFSLKKLFKFKPSNSFEKKVYTGIVVAAAIFGLLFFRMIIQLIPVIIVAVLVLIFYKIYKKGY